MSRIRHTVDDDDEEEEEAARGLIFSSKLKKIARLRRNKAASSVYDFVTSFDNMVDVQ